MLNLDTSTDFGARVARRLAEERLIWLTTVRADMVPQPSPVWFLWQDGTFLIYSKPNTQKLRNIERNTAVSLHFDGDGRGGNIIIFAGAGRIEPQAPPAHQVAEYAEKYAELIKRIGVTAEQFALAYSVPLLVTATGLRGH
ncbi:MAG: TIGR03667 family PPOX class F420-dependent oxidoreductase [Kouleothrix sp.]|nr:TIGR03667 family PPOX class F420-dependent oxidoreductase [Kouleothrix sp.]